MNSTPRDASNTTPDGEPPRAWIREPEAPPDFDVEQQPGRPDDAQPADEPGYGHGV